MDKHMEQKFHLEGSEVYDGDDEDDWVESEEGFWNEDRHLEEFTKKLKLITSNLEKLVLEFMKHQKNNNPINRVWRNPKMILVQATSGMTDIGAILGVYREMNCPLFIRIAGKVFRVERSEAAAVPHSRIDRIEKCTDLNDLNSLCDRYNVEKNEFVFNRKPDNFHLILNCYQGGKLHFGDGGCAIKFAKELEFWSIPIGFLENCCIKKFLDTQELLDFKSGWDSGKIEENEHFDGNIRGRVQKRMWQLFDKPQSSFGARVIAMISFTAIILSTIVLTLNTLPDFVDFVDGSEYPVASVIEVLTNIWFSAEFLARLLSCPNKSQFWSKLMNWVDLLAITPYYMGLMLTLYKNKVIVDQILEQSDDVDTVSKFFKVLRIVKIARSIRIFKLARHFESLQVLAYTLKSKMNEFGLLVMFSAMGAIAFSAIIYPLEKERQDGERIEDMFDGLWWAFITMGTVGYGDKIPLTDAGRVVACVCALFGVLCFGLPIPVLVMSFHKFYNVVNVKTITKQSANTNTRKTSMTPYEEEDPARPSPYQKLNNPTLNLSASTFSPHHNNPHMPRLTRRRTKNLLFKQEPMDKK